MYAIIEASGKQQKVAVGDVIYTDKLDVNPDQEYTFDKVLAVISENGMELGKPYVGGATVKAKVIKNGKQKKIVIFKMKAKKNYRRKQGHRQQYTKLEITSIKK